jgi:glucokinase
MILAGDIGGTKCTLQLFSESGGALKSVATMQVRTREFASLNDVIDRFLEQTNPSLPQSEAISAAAFGCAGTVVDDHLVTNNLPWDVKGSALAQHLRLPPGNTLLLNDLVATAASLAHLPAESLLPLNNASPQPREPKALIAAGTGLGEALLFWDGTRYRVFPSEACLTNFAPRNERELLLVQSLRQRMPHVCTEEIVSGRGFRAIHQIIFPGVQHPWFDDPQVDPAARITANAVDKSCPACIETLQIWTETYAAEAGNMALRVLPFGGVFVAGGIALKILPKMKDGTFVRVFSDKANLSQELARIPIYLVLDEAAPVLGAAYEALELSKRLS